MELPELEKPRRGGGPRRRGARLRGIATPSLLAAAALASATGCVERILAVRSDPPGARVFVDGREVGTTPCDHEFSFYGTVEVTLRAPGRLSRRELATLPAPWYQVFPLDFFTDLVIPWTIRDVHELSVELEPSPSEVAPAVRRDLDQRAEELAPLLPGAPERRRAEGP